MSNDPNTLMENMDNLLRVVWSKYQEYLIPPSGVLSVHQIFFLRFLERRQICTPSEISQEFGITLGAVTGFVDRLYKLGLIARTRSEEDRRLVLVSLTEKGKSLLEELSRQRADKTKRLLSALGENESKQLNQALERLQTVLTKLYEE
ncbi:transcriptional regulator [Desulfosporosinus acidiphilus SJ4]|uniref:Transcriptional regulator n=1 Tax=Desulfosporosinus acidiphilus (strain DSM 22704 / JCM 16185 / SJ4) TaxID=646529 RepID=I4D4A9_DESAJ|nr:MarR family transcriptional regulator [Desulfosporosinus acidiphilus]AFM40633.1 transcriptional regulator [Desulfosporosinus acidiphilus SJ4]